MFERDDFDQTNDPSAFDILPDEMLNKISMHLCLSADQSSQSVFSSTCHRFYKINNPNRFLNTFLQSRLLNTFLQAVVDGNQEKAEAILKDYPNLLRQLLTKKDTVVDPAHRTINSTALQIAASASDFKYQDDEECMTEMLTRYVWQLSDGETIIQQQMAEQFPEGWEEIEKARLENDLRELNFVVSAIANAPANDNCRSEIVDFNAHLRAVNKNRDVIKTGIHFNAQLYAAARQLFADKFIQLGGSMKSPKNDMFREHILTEIEKNLTACFLQALNQDINTITIHRQKLYRKPTLLNVPGVTFFPYKTPPEINLKTEELAALGQRKDADIGQNRYHAATQIQAYVTHNTQRRKDYIAASQTSSPRFTRS